MPEPVRVLESAAKRGTLGVVAMSLNGKFVAAKRGKKIVDVWDDRGAVSSSTSGREFPIQELAISNNGLYVVSLSEKAKLPRDNQVVSMGGISLKELCVWSRLGAGEVRTLEPPKRLNANSLVIHPDDKRAMLLDDSPVYNDLDQGPRLVELLHVGEGNNYMTLSTDGTKLAVSKSNGHIEIWGIDSQEHVATCQGHESPADRLAFSTDGEEIVSISEDSTIRVWNVNTGTEIGSRSVDCSVPFYLCHVGQSEGWLLVDSDTGVRYFKEDFSGLVEKKLPSQNTMTGIAGSQEAGLVAIGHSTGYVNVWKVEDLITL